MNRILLIEDGQMITHALSSSISKELAIEIDSVDSLAEAKARLAVNHDYFAVLTGQSDPDAPDNEALDEIMQLHIPVVVITASFSEKKHGMNYSSEALLIILSMIQSIHSAISSIFCSASI